MPPTVRLNMEDIPKPTVQDCVNTSRRAFASGTTKSLQFRKKQLQELLRMYDETSDEFYAALSKDLRKPKQESFMSEYKMITNELKNLIYNFNKYTKPERVSKSLDYIFDTPMVVQEPYGVVLIIGAWNYPMQVSLIPLAGAIAAGNTVIIKPSELAPHSAKYMWSNISKYLDKNCYQVYLGGIEDTTNLLKQNLDYIFFTGSSQVGRIIQQAAAENLTPTTLELGGKCPVIIDDEVDIKTATRRIIWGKFLNAGQTCVGPDYILCTKETQQQFLIHTKEILHHFYRGDPKNSKDYSRIVTKKHFNRLINLLKDSNIEIGGTHDENDLYISPTILTNVKLTDRIMQEEIFGPILPIITISNLQDAVSIINSRDKPLALYVFSKNDQNVDYIIENTSSGGVTVNDTVVQLLCGNLPFGGVGKSGIGAYHGKATFDTFSHRKNVLKKSFFPLAEKIQSIRYPPYSENKIRMVSVLTEKRNYWPVKFFIYLFVFIAGLVVGYIIQDVLGISK